MSKSDLLKGINSRERRRVEQDGSTGIRGWRDLSYREQLNFLSRNGRTSLVWLASILFIGLSLSFGLASELKREQKKIEDDALKSVAILSKSYAEYLGRTIEQLDQITLQIKYDWERSGGAYRLDEPGVKAIFNLSHAAATTIVDRNGAPVTSTYPLIKGASWSKSEAFSFHQKDNADEIHLSMPTRGELSGKIIVRISRGLKGPHGEFAGMVIASVTPEYFFSFANASVLGDKGFQALTDKNGVVRVAKESVSKPWHLAPLFLTIRPTIRPMLVSGQQSFYDKTDRYVASYPLDGYPFYAVVGMDRETVLSRYLAHQRTVYFVAILIAIFLCLAAVFSVVTSYRLAWKTRRLDAVRNTYRIATEFGNEGYYIWSAIQNSEGFLFDFEIIDCNERGASIFGTVKEDLLHARLSQVAPVHSYFSTLMQHATIAMEKGFYEDDFELVAEQNAHSWLHKRMVRSDDGLAVTLRDVSDLKKHEGELNRLAMRDALTTLPNRHWLMGHLPVALERAEKLGKSLAVIFIDLDDFKTVNDTLGHTAGDQLLQIVAMRLQSALRPGDSVVRLGGDEFMVLLENLSMENTLAPIAERIIHDFKEPFKIQEKTLSIGSSLGISRYPFDGKDAETLIKNADIAMYSAKDGGKNQFCIYDQSLYEEIERRVEIERQLSKAIQDDQFIMHYQPRTDTRSGFLVGMEALVRWVHPDRGIVSPDEFIPVAERTGMISLLGKIVMEKVCMQLADWRADGQAIVPISINVSARQFNEGDVSDFIKSLLEKYHLPARFVEIELTESAMMGEFDHVYRQLKAIRDLGITLHVDDFGTGYSSLSMLHKFNMDVLKVDRSFTGQICNGNGGEIFFSSIVSMAKALKMRVVAEGVETMSQLRILKLLGCDEVQGYLISRPMMAKDVPELLKKGRLSENIFSMLGTS
jgi:diguanylate cyclase (GGDEF)-like protein